MFFCECLEPVAAPGRGRGRGGLARIGGRAGWGNTHPGEAGVGIRKGEAAPRREGEEREMRDAYAVCVRWGWGVWFGPWNYLHSEPLTIDYRLFIFETLTSSLLPTIDRILNHANRSSNSIIP